MLTGFSLLNFIVSLVIVALLVAGVVYAIRSWRKAARSRAQHKRAGSGEHHAAP